MMNDQAVEAITNTIYEIETSVPRPEVLAQVGKFLPKHPMALRLLDTLEKDVGLLTSQSDTMPAALEKIIVALIAAGATTLKPPRCFKCHCARLLSGRIGIHRICASCYARDRTVFVECSQCSETRRQHATVALQDWCTRCWNAQVPQGFALLRTAVKAGDKTITDSVAEDGIRQAFGETSSGIVLRLALELAEAGSTWFSNPAIGSIPFLKLHDALLECGASLVPSVCGHCGRASKLGSTLNGLRCCRRCYYNGLRKECSQCGRDEVIFRRQVDGSGLCQSCTKILPEELVACLVCQRIRFAAWNGPDGPVCSICRPRQLIDFCPTCQRRKPCLFAGTPKAQCHECSKRLEPCGKCGQTRQISTRDSAGAAVCKMCARRPEECADCGRFRIVVGRLDGKALCEYCYQRNPVSFRDCLRCESHQHLFESGLCERCTADDKIEALFPRSLRNSNSVARAVYDVCRKATPQTILLAGRNSSMNILATIMESNDNLSHVFLDHAGSEQATLAVRSLLVDAGLLPQRDNHLARFEQWIVSTAEEIPEQKERIAFIQFARWRHLRRLRKYSAPIPGSLTTSSRRELHLVIELLNWLRDQGRQLDSLTQADIERWRSSGSAEKYRVKAFLRWAHNNKLVRKVEIYRPPRTPVGVTGTSETERFRLLSNILNPESAVPVATRFSAALVLLFGARPQHITALKVSDVIIAGPEIHLRLGKEPVLLPHVLRDLAIATFAQRSAPRLLGPTSDSQWLIPGSRSGYPLSAVTLAKRLRTIGVSPCNGRTGALASLAQDLPPTLLARLTGISLSTAIQWATAVSASNARYAALAMQSQSSAYTRSIAGGDSFSSRVTGDIR